MRPSHGIIACLWLAAGLAPGIARAAGNADSFPVNKLGLVPQPRHIRAYAAKWSLPPRLRIAAAGAADRRMARFLERFLNKRGIQAKIVATGRVQITLATHADNPQLGRQGYRLAVTSRGAAITANAGPGLFYGLQTFEELFNPALPADNAIHQVVITDWPRYRWRGIMLDSVRHFFPLPVVEKFIRVAAHYKLNRLHWHLSDNQGWRIQIPQYPLLTKIGAWRPNSSPFCGPPAPAHGPRYGGYYTQAQIREIVAYAQQRCVTIVPEIDIPGHCGAAIAAYPWLSGPRKGGSLLSPGPQTFRFLKTVFGDLVSLFPGKFIHIGGDEVNVQAWAHNPVVQKLMRQRHWTNLQQVHDYFARKMARFLAARGRRAVVWNDVPVQGLPASAVVECWNSSRVVKHDARWGHDVIVAQTGKLYFDHYQGDPRYEPPAIGGLTTLRETYNCNPSSLLPPALKNRLFGAEGCLWTEYVFSAHHLFYMLLPHALALAEICWTPLQEQRYSSFVQRTARQYLWLRANGYNFRTPPPAFRFSGAGGRTTVTRHPSHNSIHIHTTSLTGWVRLTQPVPGAMIFYTLNGGYIYSDFYSSPIRVTLAPGKPLLIRAVTIDPPDRTSVPSNLVLQLAAAPARAAK